MRHFGVYKFKRRKLLVVITYNGQDVKNFRIKSIMMAIVVTLMMIRVVVT